MLGSLGSTVINNFINLYVHFQLSSRYVNKGIFNVYQSVMASNTLETSYVMWEIHPTLALFPLTDLICRIGLLSTDQPSQTKILSIVRLISSLSTEILYLTQKKVVFLSLLPYAVRHSLRLFDIALQISGIYKQKIKSIRNPLIIKTVEEHLKNARYDQILEYPEEILLGPFKDSIPICPITHLPIRFAVIDPTCKHLCEKEALEKWVRQHGTSPFTRKVLRLEEILPSTETQNWIDFSLRCASDYLKMQDKESNCSRNSAKSCLQ